MLDALVQEVQKSAKYREVSVDFIRRIGTEELAKRNNLKEAIKATKNKLHQTTAAFLGEMRYGRWLAELRGLDPFSSEFKAACRKIMEQHASTRERLPILEEFYGTLLGDLPPITSIIDIACGLNPLTCAWIPLAPEAAYYAYDIHYDMMAFLNEVLKLRGFSPYAETQDVGLFIPDQPVDVALVLKTLPCLEQVQKKGSLALLQNLNAKRIIVSFPARSLGGRSKGMVENYSEGFYALVEGQGWEIQKTLFDNELAFTIIKP
jgi:16S rRNA (guanine(1405)-N(7))-methyltransferase